MKFVRLGEDTIRLDLIVRIREGRVDETLYGRNVRKTSDREGWLEVHFLDGETLKIVGAHAEILRRLLETEYGVKDLAPSAQPEPSDIHDPSRHAAHGRPMPHPSAYRTAF